MRTMAEKKVEQTNKPITVRFALDEAERVARAARSADAFGTVSDFIRVAVMKEVERIERKQGK